MRRWLYSPHTGGQSIPPACKARTERRILDYAARHYPGKFIRVGVRFQAPSATSMCTRNPTSRERVPHLAARRVTSGSHNSGIPPYISAGFATSETKTGGVSPGTAMPTKSTSRVS